MPNNPLLKNSENIQFARTANQVGDRTIPQGGINPDYGVEPLADNDGRLIVRIADRNGYVPFFSTPILLKTNITPASATGDALPAAINSFYFEISGYSNYGGGPSFLQIHNVAPPIPVFAVPWFQLPVATGPLAFFETFKLPRLLAGSNSIVLSGTPGVFAPLPGTFLQYWGEYKQ